MNNLPPSIQQCDKISLFKNQQHQHLMNNVWTILCPQMRNIGISMTIYYYYFFLFPFLFSLSYSRSWYFHTRIGKHSTFCTLPLPARGSSSTAAGAAASTLLCNPCCTALSVTDDQRPAATGRHSTLLVNRGRKDQAFHRNSR